MKKRALPYASSNCNPAHAKGRITEMLRKFGVSRVSFDEDFGKGLLFLRFIYNDYPVSIPVNYKEMAKLYVNADPFTYRKRGTRVEWDERKSDVAYKAAFSALEDFLKGSFTIIEMKVMTFEELFLGSFVMKGGQRIGEAFLPRLSELVKTGQLALTGGN